MRNRNETGNNIKLIEKSLTAIYGYAYDKLYNKSEAEELSQEIVLEILRSAEHLKTDAAFWGFAWRIAENTFRKFIKRREFKVPADLGQQGLLSVKKVTIFLVLTRQ